MSDFPNGIIAKRNARAPEWHKCKLSFKVQEFIQTLQDNQQNGWLNLEVNMSKAGKPYVKFDRRDDDQSACTGYKTKVQDTQAPFPAQEPEDTLTGLDDTPPF